MCVSIIALSCFWTFGPKVLGIFVLRERQFHRNESSWNVRCRGTKVPRSECSSERKFLERSRSKNESYTGAKVLSGLFAPKNKSAEE